MRKNYSNSVCDVGGGGHAYVISDATCGICAVLSKKNLSAHGRTDRHQQESRGLYYPLSLPDPCGTCGVQRARDLARGEDKYSLYGENEARSMGRDADSTRTLTAVKAMVIWFGNASNVS